MVDDDVTDGGPLDRDQVGRGPAVAVADEHRGTGLIRLSWFGTGLYLVVALAATVRPEGFALALLIVCVGLFLVGAGAFFAAYVIAIGRSRRDAIGMGGLFFLSGSAPRRVRYHLLGSFAVEVIVALVTASIGLAGTSTDADNPLAFGILTPLYGLGLAGLWGARHGVFPPRADAAGNRAGPTRPTGGVAGGSEGAG